jgi:hypothetical protein
MGNNLSEKRAVSFNFRGHNSAVTGFKTICMHFSFPELQDLGYYFQLRGNTHIYTHKTKAHMGRDLPFVKEARYSLAL